MKTREAPMSADTFRDLAADWVTNVMENYAARLMRRRRTNADPDPQ